MDHSLSTEESSGGPSLPVLRSVSDLVVGAAHESRATVLISEGLPPIQVKLLEKIRRWEFVDLALLLHDPSSRLEELLLQQKGEVMIVQSVEQAQKRRKQIVDIFTWSKAFAIYGAALCSEETTTREEAVGLWAHMHLITQLSRDLGGGQWLAYDTEFREWAAAKGVRKWGELNLTIYGKCLSDRIAFNPLMSSPQPLQSIKTAGSKRSSSRDRVCFQWNFSATCERGEACKFSHACYYCHSSHKGRDCKGSARSKKGRFGDSMGEL